jgi:hypothetical protein
MKSRVIIASIVAVGVVIGAVTYFLSASSPSGAIGNASSTIAKTATSECIIHVGHQGHPGVLSLNQSPDTSDWPLFSNGLYSFVYPPNWKVSTFYSSTTDEYESYAFPDDNPKNQMGTMVNFTHKAITTSEISSDISLHTSLPIEQLNCAFNGRPATIFNVGDNSDSYYLKVVMLENHATSYLMLIEPSQASQEDLDAFKGILNSFSEKNLLPGKAK